MPLPPSWSPIDEYKLRQRSHEQQVNALEARHVLLGYLKLLLVVAFATAAWTWFDHRYNTPWPTGIIALLFIAVSILHAQVLRGQERKRRAVTVYSKGLERIEDRWPRTTQRDLPAEPIAESLFAKDLDIVGPGSLFELLCLARTRMGEHHLLDWLLHPASLDTIFQRQAAILELRSQLDFRERMAVTGEAVSVPIQPEFLRNWSQSSTPFEGQWVRWLATGLSLIALAAAYVWLAHGLVAPLVGVVIVEAILARLLKARMNALFDGAGKSSQHLSLVASLLLEIERHTFEAPYLKEIQQRLLTQRIPASEAIAKLSTLVSYKDAFENPILRLIDLPLMCSVQVAFAMYGWRQWHAHELSSWLDAIGDMEALLSLAAYTYEHPSDPFPTFVEGPPSLHAQQIGHPLIPAAKCVRNTVTIRDRTRVLLISGSNMSGKSTLMRTIGINTVLAMCGAPVRAEQMHLTPLRIGASLLVNDSLQRGASRFYAEIEKLQAICSLAHQPGLPVLFLLDEVLQGTNSNDRLIGAQGITHDLISSGAIGILTTHDLSLTAIDNGDGAIENHHFQDAIVDSKMQFDFLLRDGVVTRSNGIELMWLIGLRV
jgi:hypothetical protein